MSAFAGYWRTRKPFFSFLAVAALVVLVYLIAAEIALRFLPVATGLNPLPTDAAQPLLHFEPGFHYTFSRRWNLRGANRGRVNNAGWVNDQDYRRDDPQPLIAVIGNSYIEAQMVPYGDTLQARLAAALAGSYRVYSFAASGAPLAQYAVYARHAVQAYHARALVIVVTAFSAAEGYGTAEPGLWYYASDGDRLTLHLRPYRRGLAVRLARHSTLMRYLVFNLNIVPQVGAIWYRLLHPWARFTLRAAIPPEQRKVVSDAVIDAFLRDLGEMTGLPPERVLFVLDGFRYPALAAAQRGTPEAAWRAGFIVAAAARGYAVADTEPLFFTRYRETGAHFESPDDRHWNAAGHAVAAETVLTSPWLDEIRRSVH